MFVKTPAKLVFVSNVSCHNTSPPHVDVHKHNQTLPTLAAGLTDREGKRLRKNVQRYCVDIVCGRTNRKVPSL